MNEQEKLIAEQIKTLPSELVQAINAVPWKSLVQEIGKTNNLTPDQMVLLEQETMFILYSFESPANYTQNLVRELGTTEEVVSTIADSVAEKILSPISEKIISDEQKTSSPQVNNMQGKTLHVGEETKEDAMKRLVEKRENIGQRPSVPEIVPEIEAPKEKLLPPIQPTTVDPAPQQVGYGTDNSQPTLNNPSPTVITVAPKLDIQVPAPAPEVEKPKLAETPDLRYPDGGDPYREPVK